ncbi:F-box domain, cyclin-like protein [Artemisia annua]|uniref:F-box domain, cyclin-like protein n=1 Tax=Artemisia annua TaxID=35608 RepID=A0A2U1MT62_ARTAN|nr:F-box domain, cyclin-like protein [Artemisia annua]
MGSIHDGAEDRISNMPEDIIQHILSFLDTKYAVQFCTVSPKWENIWTSMRHLNFNNESFSSVPKFDKFMEHALSHRNNQTEVCAVRLRFSGEKILDTVIDIVNYAYLHNVQELTIQCGSVYEFPHCLFSSPTLKHLSLSSSSNTKSRITSSYWNMPALETLYLRDIRLGDARNTSPDLFFKSEELESLTLENCSMYNLEAFIVSAPNLLDLTITRTCRFPEDFYVYAPQLETLTAGGYSSSYQFLKLTTEEVLDSLEKVNLSLSSNIQKRERHFASLLDLLEKVPSAKTLILDMNIVEMLSSCMDELSHKPCPFSNLECLKINTGTWKGKDNIPSMPSQVRNFLLRNSPNATFIMDIPPQINMAPPKQKDRIPTFPIQVSNCSPEKSPNATFVMDLPLQVLQKRSRQQLSDDTMANKVPKLFADNEQPATMVAENRILKEKLQMQEQLVATLGAYIFKCKIAELEVQVKSGNPDYNAIRSMNSDINSVMDLIHVSLRVDMEAQFSYQYKQVKSRLYNCIDAIQWATIETELGLISLFGRICFNNINSQSHVRATELSRPPRPSSANVASSLKSVWTGSNNWVI